MQPERVDDFLDPRLADYQNLKDARLLAERGRFMVEGRGNLRVLLERTSITPDSILLSERTHGALEDLLREWAPRCPVYVAERAVLDRIVGFPIHRGVLAVCARPAPCDPLALARAALEREPAPRLVVLEGIIDHDNVGGIFRNAMGLGARAVLLCPRTVDPLYRKAVRTSMGGSLVVPFGRSADLAALLDDLRALGFETLALDPAPSGSDLASLDPERLGPAALLLGTEGRGLTEGALARADRRLRIAMESGVDSLNVSVAAGIALHRLRRHASGRAEPLAGLSRAAAAGASAGPRRSDPGAARGASLESDEEES